MKIIFEVDVKQIKSKDELLRFVDRCLVEDFVESWSCEEDIFAFASFPKKYKHIVTVEKIDEVQDKDEGGKS